MNAHQTYQKIQREALSGRDIEVRVLRKAAVQFRQVLAESTSAGRNRLLDGAVRYNLRVWDVFHADWERPDCPLNPTLRNDLIRLSVYVHKTSLEVLAYGDAEKIHSLININDCLAEGLLAGSHTPAPALAAV
jgi:flagellar protein FlaF